MSETRVGRRLAALVLALMLGGCVPVGDDRPGSAGSRSSIDGVPVAMDGMAGSETFRLASAAAFAQARMSLLPQAPRPEIFGPMATTMSDMAGTAANLPIIEVQFSGERMPDAVLMVTPDGDEIEPLAIERMVANAPSLDDDEIFRAGLNGTSLTGLKAKFAIGFPFGGIEPADRPPSIRTLARFSVPDVPHYERNWMRYRVVILHAPGTPEEQRFEMLPPHPDAMME